MEIKTVLIIIHLFGVVVGTGGAFAADYTFFQSIRDGKISKTEESFIKNSSKMVWLGLLVLFLSGLGLFLEDTAKYLASSKFISKMIITLIIVLNGVLFHFVHIPTLQKSLNINLKKSKFFSTIKKSIYPKWSGFGSLSGSPLLFWCFEEFKSNPLLCGTSYVLVM